MPEPGSTPAEAAQDQGFGPYVPTPEPELEPVQTEPPLPEFDPKWRDEFQGLLYVGALTDTFVWLGHTFVIRTLTTGELLEVALATKRYDGTEGSMKAYQAAVVAGCVISVDGQPLPSPITTEVGDTPFLNRHRYVMDKWYSPVLDAIYQRYYELEITVVRVIEAMGKVSG